jgi:uncharacterized protein (DUF1697 family)
MPVYCALLRAVNVGGTLLPMAELRAICEALGFAEVQTYIQSGNVLFRTNLSEADAAERLDAALGERLGKPPGVMIRTAPQLRAVVDQAPYPDAPPNHVLVHFLAKPAPADALDALVAPDGEQAKIAGREIYVHYPIGSGRSKMKLPAIKSGTSRNLNTVRRLSEMATVMDN